VRVGAALGEPRRVVRRIQRGHLHLLAVGRQPGGHVRESEEHAVANEVEERGGRQAGSLPDQGAVAPATARAPVLQRVVVGSADDALDEAVAFDPARLLRAPKRRPDLRTEPIEQVEERGGV